MLLTSSNKSKQGIKKRTINRVVQVGPLSLRFMTLIMLAVVALFYLAQSTQSATKKYTVRGLDNEKQELTKEKDRLQIEATRLKSLQQIQSGVDKLELEQN